MANNNSRTVNIIIALTGLLSILIIHIYHKLKLNDLFWEGYPVLTVEYIAESLLILFSTFLFIFGITRGKDHHQVLFEKKSYHTIFSSVVSLIFAILFLSLFIFEPTIFSRLSLEDGIIEWLSAVFLFSCSFVFVLTAIKYRGSLSYAMIRQWAFIIMAFIFFVIAMEEISWFQRVLSIEVEENSILKLNYQNEINLHNFATNYAENLYYFGAFLFLVLLPYLKFIFPCFFKKFYLSLFIPRPYVAVIGSLFCAYNFDMWNIPLTQIAFFGTLMILFSYWQICASKNYRSIISISIILTFTSQIVFLLNGSNYSRIWEITEYKEFLIPFGFLIYSIDMYQIIHLESKNANLL